jgi:glutamate-ammonia-ligase adenylyltransferase
LLERLPPAVEQLAQRHDAAAAALSARTLSGLARVVASRPEMAGFIAHRKGFVARLADLPPDPLDQRAARFEADGERILSLDLEDALDALRLRRREEMAFAACLDLGGVIAFERVSEFLSLLAESTLEISLAMARRETPGESGSAFAVLGMGKLAGRELTYHSDLDLIFLFRGGPDLIARASRIGQRLISYLTTMTGAGVAYDVDTRLRPSGRQGMLVTSFDAFEAYQMKTAALWEHLAQLRGRVVAGSDEARSVLDRVHAHILETRTPPWSELAPLRDQVEAERAAVGDGVIALKTGAGGLMDVDFLAGGGLLERGSEHFPEVPSVPAMLRACASGASIDALIADYELLRRVEARMRWIAGRGVEVLADDAAAVVAELVVPGDGVETLRQRIGAARERIRAAFAAVVAAGSLSALDGRARP